MRDLKADLDKWKNIPNFANNPEVIAWINEVLPEAINRAIAAEETNKHLHELIAEQGKKIQEYESNTAFVKVTALTEENSRLTAQVAGLRGAATEYLYAMSDSKAGIAVEINAKRRLTEMLNSPDPGEKYRERMEQMESIIALHVKKKQICDDWRNRIDMPTEPSEEFVKRAYEVKDMDRQIEKALAALEGGCA